MSSLTFIKGDMSVNEYALNFTQMSKYAPTIVVDLPFKVLWSKPFQGKVNIEKILLECRWCGRIHEGKCLAGSNACVFFGKIIH